MIDVDHFKRFNDSFGHLVGDGVLKTVVALTQKCIREHDYFGRYGGEEFMLILPETDLVTAERCAERVRSAIAMHSRTELQDGHALTVSIGVATYHKDESIQHFIDQADQQLYRAKHEGRNRVCVQPSGDLGEYI
jgi:diguanylate cyclase (GGDEF)-like protein